MALSTDEALTRIRLIVPVFDGPGQFVFRKVERPVEIKLAARTSTSAREPKVRFARKRGWQAYSTIDQLA